ncbi:glycoside hydrolase family 88/105 protein [Paenibacillus sp. y28]|uniref:glycoside hydrolase family 88/105 protein n=1 Tax=Paenibacillus sp. y28 TaxID=3129110 RepID=UPI003019B7D6
MAYFPEHDSINTVISSTEEVLSAIANRHIGAHPKHGPVFRVFAREGFIRQSDYRYVMNVEDKIPDVREGQFVYAWAKLWSGEERDMPLSVSCFSPLHVYVNGERRFKSNLNDDVFPDRKNWFHVRVNQGWNHVVLRFLKTATGCGGLFGTGSIKGAPLHFLAPSAERSGQEGWIFSEPLDAPLSELPGEGMSEADTGLRWYPKREWETHTLEQSAVERLFGSPQDSCAVAWTRLRRTGGDGLTVQLRGMRRGAGEIYVNGREVYSSTASGSAGAFSVQAALKPGLNDMIIRSHSGGGQWGLELEDVQGEDSGFELPVPVRGAPDAWLYAGPFSAGIPFQAEDFCSMHTVFKDGKDGTYWQVDLPDSWVRPYLETALFGKWNYPLGVTLYGLLQSGEVLERPDYVRYVLDHIELCTRWDEYARWDLQQYGAPGLNHQLAAIDSLDDCGSFGAVTLRAMNHRELRGAEPAIERIASYIRHEQDRLADGALYRVRGSADFMERTMWCDDLYMSVPFLCRYYVRTGNEEALLDAARQFKLYKSYLFMPDQSIMHHVYDFKFNKPNTVPWGRGNGWVLFSLTELLTVMPQKHELRGELLQFYRELCGGYLALQGGNGLWHQVLTDPESYEESSCTSMFIYAFARGVRQGWLTNPGPYSAAAAKGWDGLRRLAIDKHGHIYGVCRGSGFSFNKLYYKDELSWLLDDTHGIGIILLAGLEALKLERFLAESAD